MKTRFIIILLLILALGTFSCTKKQSNLPDESLKVSEFRTIPSFKAMFLALDKIEETELSNLPLTKIIPAQNDTLYLAFAWGVLTSDAQLAIASKNQNQLTSITDQFIAIAPQLGLTQYGYQLRDAVKPEIKNRDWLLLREVFYAMQTSVDTLMLSNGREKELTFISLGSWTETTNQIARLIASDYSTEKSRTLMTNAWQDLAFNLNLILNKDKITSPLLSQTIELVHKIQNTLSSGTAEALTLEQVETIVEYTKTLKELYLES
ncbi:MAG: hypothetical protein WC179_03490 [Candidatus Cloacimonadaceae bacterium]|jgi:hypothetical protein|nr:hypothetical protein [Candidatus Cloacimonadota bacterium]MCB5257768.1 hypothetical protein [Candidatus Cloacimonadota bacterium]MDD5624753.1 hypothetical protein [Candidatus Cloacimonadota bacterium]MDY0111692.1 hypothetical protein [Candidatus Syntrophosphaera sp.]